MKRLLILLAALYLTATSTPGCAQTLEKVRQRGALLCGSSQGLPGFGFPDSAGNWKGFDVDYCRAIAAAVFGDGSKVKFVPLSPKDRFTALQSGEVDVLIRNTTWTMSRNAQLGLDFPAVNYFDGQAFMVRKSLNAHSVSDLKDASICVAQGSTTELNLADYFRSRGLAFEAVTFADTDSAVKAYEDGRCDSFTNDATSLYGYSKKLTNPEDHVILPEIISKEPLAIGVRKGDAQWSDIVRWVHYALVNAEELGVTQANLADQLKSTNPEVKRLLGIDAKFGEPLGLTANWSVDAIKATGNYGEIFERNLGAGSPLKIKRGINSLWNKGGLQYGIPIR
jgi:general L-amino acid transport system substrate-binding protein